jgi:serine/threonine protein kinase
MVTGSLPFIANSVPELSAKVLLERHEPLNSRRPDLPDALEQIVTKALCKNAADRFPSIAEFAMELLPFAPQRARANVERITKVLQAAGLSTSQFSASTRPPPLTASESSEVSVSMKTLTGHDGESTDGRRSSATLETGSLPGATQVAFGNTAAPRRSGRLGLLAVLVTFVVLLAGGAAYVLTDSKGPSAKQPAGTARQPFAELTPLVKHSPETAPTNSEAAMLAVVDAGKPADDKSEKNLQTVEPKAVKPTAREKPRSAPKPASKKIWSAPTKATLKESESFGEFGGRK